MKILRGSVWHEKIKISDLPKEKRRYRIQLRKNIEQFSIQEDWKVFSKIHIVKRHQKFLYNLSNMLFVEQRITEQQEKLCV